MISGHLVGFKSANLRALIATYSYKMQASMALQFSKWLIRTSIQWSNHVSVAMRSDLIVCHMPSFKFHLARFIEMEVKQKDEKNTSKNIVVEQASWFPTSWISLLEIYCQFWTNSVTNSLQVANCIIWRNGRQILLLLHQPAESAELDSSVSKCQRNPRKSWENWKICIKPVVGGSHLIFVPRPGIANHWRCSPNGAPCLKRCESGRVSEFPIWISIYRGPSTCLTWKHIEIRDVKHESLLFHEWKKAIASVSPKKEC